MRHIPYDSGRPQHKRSIPYGPTSQPASGQYPKYRPEAALPADSQFAAPRPGDTFLQLLSTPDAAGKESMNYLIQSLVASRHAMQLEISAAAREVTIGVRCKTDTVADIERFVRGVGRGIEMQRTSPPTLPLAHPTLVSVLGPENKPDWEPLPALEHFGQQDPLQILLEAVQPLQADERFLLALLIRPADLKRVQKAYEALYVPFSTGNLVRDVLLFWQGRRAKVPKFPDPQYQKRLEQRLTSDQLLEVVGRFCLSGPSANRLQARASSLSKAIAAYFGGEGYGLRLADWDFDSAGLGHFDEWPEDIPCLLTSIPELSSLWKLPSERLSAVPGISFVQWPEVTLPPEISSAGGILLGQIRSRGQVKRVYLGYQDAQQGPVILVGKTGQGKSELMKQYSRHQLQRLDNPGLCVIDANARLAMETITECVPDRRLHQAYLVEYGNQEYVPSISLFQPPAGSTEEQITQYVDALVAAFRLLFSSYNLTARMEDALYAVVATLCRMPNATLLDISRLFFNRKIRLQAISQLMDIAALEFWREYDVLSPRAQQELAQPLLRRLRILYRAPSERRIFCQTLGQDSTLAGGGEIIANNLAGPAIASSVDIIGEIIIARRHLAIQAKMGQKQKAAHPEIIAIDESARYCGQALSLLLRESRKVNTSLLMAVQYIDAWTDNIINSVLGNFGTAVAFSCSPQDARRLAPVLAPYTQEQIQALDRYQALVKMYWNGRNIPTFDMRTLKVESQRTEEQQEWLLEHIRLQTTDKYCRPKAEVEAEIAQRYQAQAASDSAGVDPSDGPTEEKFLDDIYED